MGRPDRRSFNVALLWRGDREARITATAEGSRLKAVFAALARRGISAEPAVYSDDMAEEVRDQLLRVDGVLVWVDPISGGLRRSRLDPLLREAAANGVWVSAHPDVILKMGVKEVLYRTRELGWGTDTHLYETVQAFEAEFPRRVAGGPRVLKQNRGNGGIGVWKVEVADASADDAPSADVLVRAQEARGDGAPETLRLSVFMARCVEYFRGEGRLIDQPFQPRLPEGMIRCYMSRDRVVGFGRQIIRGLMPPPAPAEGPEAGRPGPRIMSGAAYPPFQPLRAKMEREWTPAMTRLLNVDPAALPVIWDADFLLGPKTAGGEDTYVLCEINVSSVFPIPDEGPDEIAASVLACLAAAQGRRAAGVTPP